MTHDLSGIKTAKGLRMLEHVRGICKPLPEVTELIDGHGHTTFKVKDKSFIIMSDHGVTFKSDLNNQEILLQEDRFFKPAYIGHRGWVSISDPADWQEMGVLLKEAYMHAAPKRLIKLLMETEH